jgi:hypothetical protein
MHVTHVLGAFEIRGSERRALLVGAKEFLYMSSLFIHFGEIRYESPARIANPLSIDVLLNNRCG